MEILTTLYTSLCIIIVIVFLFVLYIHKHIRMHAYYIEIDGVCVRVFVYVAVRVYFSTFYFGVAPTMSFFAFFSNVDCNAIINNNNNSASSNVNLRSQEETPTSKTKYKNCFPISFCIHAIFSFDVVMPLSTYQLLLFPSFSVIFPQSLLFLLVVHAGGHSVASNCTHSPTGCCPVHISISISLAHPWLGFYLIFDFRHLIGVWLLCVCIHACVCTSVCL